jgi:hypothetical protein
MNKETLIEAARAAPPAGVTGLTVWGVGLQDWVYVLTAIYTLFLIIDKAPNTWARVKEWFK